MPGSIWGSNPRNGRWPIGGSAAHAFGPRVCPVRAAQLMPTLYSSLKRLHYPLAENEAHYTHAWLARQPGTYALLPAPVRVALVSAAMPNLGSASGARRGERRLQPGTQAQP